MEEGGHNSASFLIDNISNQTTYLGCIQLLNILIEDAVKEELRMHGLY